MYWALPAWIVLYALFGKPNTEGFLWATLLAAISCGIPIYAVRHDGSSFIAIIALLHALYYPIAVLVNLMASSAGVYEVDLWNSTPAAMKALCIGMSGFAIGAFVARRRRPVAMRSLESARTEILAIPAARLVALSLLILPLAAFKIATGTYFHYQAAGELGWSEKNALAYGYVGYLEYIVYGALFLQWQRYVISRARRDLIYALAMTALPVLVMAPSGSRDMAFRGVVPLIFVALVRLKSRISIKLVVGLSAGSMLFLFLLVALQSYRGHIYYEEPESVSWSKRLSLMVGATTSTLNEYDQLLQQLGRRFADYPVVGSIVNFYPNRSEYRGFEGVLYWPIYLLPNPIRPNTPGFDPRDSATLSETVGIWVGGGSTPAMILGDLYSRFSWGGVFIGMGLLASLFCLLEGRLKRSGILESWVYGMLLLSVAKLPQESLFGHFLFFTRHLAIIVILALFLKRITQKKHGFSRICQHIPSEGAI